MCCLAPLVVDCNSHSPNKMNYSILHPNVRARIGMHKGVLELCRAWCGTYHIGVKDSLPFFWAAHYKIDTQLYQKLSNIAYCVTIDNTPCCTCLDFTKMSSHSLGKKEKRVCYKHLLCLDFCAGWIMIVTNSCTLQHTPTTRMLVSDIYRCALF